jgi:hypothetical protein
VKFRKVTFHFFPSWEPIFLRKMGFFGQNFREKKCQKPQKVASDLSRFRIFYKKWFLRQKVKIICVFAVFSLNLVMEVNPFLKNTPFWWPGKSGFFFSRNYRIYLDKWGFRWPKSDLQNGPKHVMEMGPKKGVFFHFSIDIGPFWYPIMLKFGLRTPKKGRCLREKWPLGCPKVSKSDLSPKKTPLF